MKTAWSNEYNHVMIFIYFSISLMLCTAGNKYKSAVVWMQQEVGFILQILFHVHLRLQFNSIWCEEIHGRWKIHWLSFSLSLSLSSFLSLYFFVIQFYLMNSSPLENGIIAHRSQEYSNKWRNTMKLHGTWIETTRNQRKCAIKI